MDHYRSATGHRFLDSFFPAVGLRILVVFSYYLNRKYNLPIDEEFLSQELNLLAFKIEREVLKEISKYPGTPEIYSNLCTEDAINRTFDFLIAVAWAENYIPVSCDENGLITWRKYSDGK